MTTLGDVDLEGYREGLEVGELRCQRCLGCGRAWWPPRAACPRCSSSEYEWMALPTSGVLYTWTVVGRTTLAEFVDRTPYAVGVIAFPAEGVRIVGFLDLPPDEATFDMDLAWEVRRNPAGEPRIHWRPRQ